MKDSMPISLARSQLIGASPRQRRSKAKGHGDALAQREAPSRLALPGSIGEEASIGPKDFDVCGHFLPRRHPTGEPIGFYAPENGASGRSISFAVVTFTGGRWASLEWGGSDRPWPDGPGAFR